VRGQAEEGNIFIFFYLFRLLKENFSLFASQWDQGNFEL